MFSNETMLNEITCAEGITKSCEHNRFIMIGLLFCDSVRSQRASTDDGVGQDKGTPKAEL